MRILIQSMMLLVMTGCAESGPTSAASGFLADIGGGIYVHHGEHLDIDTGYQGDICNVSIVVGSKGVAVIDTTGSLKVGKHAGHGKLGKAESSRPQSGSPKDYRMRDGRASSCSWRRSSHH